MADLILVRPLTEQVSRLRQRQTAPLILELDLTEGLAEGPVTDPLAMVVARRRGRLLDVIEGLRRARHDDRVRALVAKVGGGRIGLARMQEIREAVADFRQSGKLAVAWAESFGEFTHGNLPYYLATAFDRIYLQPSGSLGLTGVAVEQLFLHDALAKAGVDFQSAKRHEYKTAVDNLTERGFTGPAREAAERLAVSVAEQLTAAIAERRGKSAADARALLDRGPFLAEEALAEGLVDALGYRDEVYADVRKEAGREAILQYVARYQRGHMMAQRARRLPNPRERFVAVIYASGPIRQGRSNRSPVGDGAMGSDTVTAALRAVTADDRARAVLLRVNSPGGSAIASDAIWREVVRTRNAGKPVVVSMADVAASGGYYISMAADLIVAQPGTLTGSIGVILGKPVFQELFDRVGITTDSVALRRPGDDVRHLPTRSARTSGTGSTAGWTPSTGTSRRRWRRGAGCRWSGCTRSPGAGSGPAPTRRRTGSSTRSAGCTPRPRSPAAGRACPPTPRCGSTPGTPRSTSCASPIRARPGPRPRTPCGSAKAGVPRGASRPAPACRRTDR